MPRNGKGKLRDSIKREFARRELARRSYEAYLAYVGGPLWVPTRMSSFLARTLQSFLETDTGHAYDILLLETPPQHGKSLTVTEALPSWYLGRHPDKRVILASYNDGSGERFARRNREKLACFGELLFGVRLGDMNRSYEFNLAGERGQLLSRGILSGVTGNPADLLIVDDPVKNREEADSPAYREKLWGEWLNSLKSRLQAKAKVVVIMTPWHEDDMAGRLQKTEKRLRLVRLPVEAEEGDALGRAPGEPLCPELGKDATWLAEFKESYLSDPQGGARAWAALYMCSPRTEGGNIVQRSWWRYYEPDAFEAERAVTVLSVDATFKDGEHNDYVAIQVWSKLGAGFYLRYSLNEHLDFPGTVRAIKLVRRLYPESRYVLIEDKANGSAIIQTLRSQMLGVVPVNPAGGKVARVNAVAPAIEGGNVFLPADSPAVEPFIDQFSSFPAGSHDDMVDACTQALNFLIFSRAAAPLGEKERRRLDEEEQERTALVSGDAYNIY